MPSHFLYGLNTPRPRDPAQAAILNFEYTSLLTQYDINKPLSQTGLSPDELDNIYRKELKIPNVADKLPGNCMT